MKSQICMSIVTGRGKNAIHQQLAFPQDLHLPQLQHPELDCYRRLHLKIQWNPSCLLLLLYRCHNCAPGLHLTTQGQIQNCPVLMSLVEFRQRALAEFSVCIPYTHSPILFIVYTNLLVWICCCDPHFELGIQTHVEVEPKIIDP
ncbi:hypothetical protein Ahy_B09g097375 isoform B [Arachis hypogaea]|uniref:Uncharacterized protein n=1 Tax=Arachis hypogaea TaxID=3818 RepID=A0A444XP51_ARAHY|nr:hypothetical protein Ahy_B09g097375 isoform B [Arachis hypogaea]